jgi:SAM-dependent methyltransferase
VRRWLRPRPPFPGSEAYWRARYASGRDSGRGSRGELAAFKAEFLNAFVAEHRIASVIELGCGDGQQLQLARYPRYVGLDVCAEAVRLCRHRFAGDPTKRFELAPEHAGEEADLALSLDVVYHLVEDSVFESYMQRLFDAGRRFVIVYSSNTDRNPESGPAHVRHRHFTRWVESHRPDFRLVCRVPNPHPYRAGEGSFADFFVFSRDPWPPEGGGPPSPGLRAHARSRGD